MTVWLTALRTCVIVGKALDVFEPHLVTVLGAQVGVEAGAHHLSYARVHSLVAEKTRSTFSQAEINGHALYMSKP